MADSNPPESKSVSAASRCSLPSFQGEEDLIRALQGGDAEALKTIFDRYHRVILVTALRILHDVDEAEDLMRSVFFEVFRKAQQFDPSKSTLGNWILQYAYHRSINRKNYLSLRQFYNAIDLLNSDGEEAWITDVSSPTQEHSPFVDEALVMLKSEQREVIERVFFEGMTLKKIAEETKQDIKFVRKCFYRGLKKLRTVRSRNANRDRSLALAEQTRGANT